MAYIKDMRRAIRHCARWQKGRIMSKYQVILSTGETVRVPSDKARSNYEDIGEYGLQAVIQRAKRSRAYKTAVKQHDAHIRTIVCPNGDEVTQF